MVNCNLCDKPLAKLTKADGTVILIHAQPSMCRGPTEDLDI